MDEHEQHLLIFLKILPVALILRASLGISSTFTKAPFPSNDRGEIRSTELSNNMPGMFNSMSCVIRNCTPFPDRASVTSSIGVAGIIYSDVSCMYYDVSFLELRTIIGVDLLTG